MIVDVDAGNTSNTGNGVCVCVCIGGLHKVSASLCLSLSLALYVPCEEGLLCWLRDCECVNLGDCNELVFGMATFPNKRKGKEGGWVGFWLCHEALQTQPQKGRERERQMRKPLQV
mmetsp:Transcript_46418/g.53805  ORF Transcript_46418/g.53805 Transcript_46418/m.53805 type:complete len:116 (+) Transcript_46418:252-599(+)